MGPLARAGSCSTVDGMKIAGRRGGVWIGLVSGWLVAGCGDVEPADDTMGMGSLGGEDGGPGEAGGPGDGGGDEVPDNEYCAGVADWSEAQGRIEEQVVVLVNERRAAGARCGGQSFGATGPLTMDSTLRCAARVHSLDMVTRGFFGHDNPDGEDPFDRMQQAGYRFSTAGENIAAGQDTPEAVVEGWMESSGHCSNIMNPDFTEIGVGYVQTDAAEYPHYWTQVFGRPL